MIQANQKKIHEMYGSSTVRNIQDVYYCAFEHKTAPLSGIVLMEEALFRPTLMRYVNGMERYDITELEAKTRDEEQEKDPKFRRIAEISRGSPQPNLQYLIDMPRFVSNNGFLKQKLGIVGIYNILIPTRAAPLIEVDGSRKHYKNPYVTLKGLLIARALETKNKGFHIDLIGKVCPFPQGIYYTAVTMGDMKVRGLYE